MNLKLDKKDLKVLSFDRAVLPNELTNEVAGGVIPETKFCASVLVCSEDVSLGCGQEIQK